MRHRLVLLRLLVVIGALMAGWPALPVAAQEGGALTITKFNCPAGVLPDADPAALDDVRARTLTDLGCVPAEGVLFDIRADGEPVLPGAATVAGAIEIEGLARGTRVVVRETVPAGYAPLTPRVQRVEIGNRPQELLFINEERAPGATADLTIVKLNCDPGVQAADLAADEDLAAALVAGEADPAALGCTFADGVPFAIDGVDVGDTSAGLLVVTGLDAGTAVTVTETVPAGFVAFEPEQMVTAVPGAIVLFVDVAVAEVPAVANLIVVKLNCQEVVDPAVVDTAGLATGEMTTLPAGCALAEGVPFAVDGQPVGVTAGGLLVVPDLPVGTEVRVTETVPEGFTTQTPEQVVTIPEQDVAVLFIDEAIPPATAALQIVKLNCTEPVDLETVDVAAVVAAGVTADILGAGCGPAEGVSFFIDGEPVGATAGGVLRVEGYPVGAEVTVTESVPPGFTALDPEQTVTLAAGENALLFLDVPTAPAVADLRIVKLDCQEAIDPEAVSVDAVEAGEVPAGCTRADDVLFVATDAAGQEVARGVTEDGRAVLAGLPFGEEVTITETVPRFYRALEIARPAVVGQDEALLFVNVRGEGQVEAVKYFCGNQDRVGETAFFVPEAEVQGCRRAAGGEVTLALSGPLGELARMPTGVEGTVRFSVSAGPEYILSEVTPDPNDADPATEPFPVESGETVALNVVDYVAVTGDVLVSSLRCADLTGTTIEVARFGVPESEALAETGCIHAAASFVIYPYGDLQAEPIAGEAGADGLAYLTDIPVTTEATGPHLLVAEESGAEERFTVGPDELTVVDVVTAAASPTGTVLVAKQTCLETAAAGVEVMGPTESTAFAVPVAAPDCELAAATFAIYPHGDLAAAPITFETSPAAPALLPALPVTSEALGAHVLIEEATGLQTRFDVAAGAVTSIVVTNAEDAG